MRIVILREAGGLGDVVMTEPVLRGLREKDPQAELVYVGLEEYAPLVRQFSAPPDAYVAIRRHQRRLRDAEPDPVRWPYLKIVHEAERVIDLYCPAYRHERKYAHAVFRSRVECFCAAADVSPSAPALLVTPEDRQWAEGCLAGLGIDGQRVTALAPWTCSTRRQWPKGNWIELARRLPDAGFVPLVLHAFGGPVADIPAARVTGRPLPKVAALLSLCEVAITHDSGLLHLSAAVGCRTLSLWGSTNPAVALAQYPNARWIWKPDALTRPRACRSPCFSMPGSCDRNTCRGGCRILDAITVEEVIEELEG